MSKTVPRGHFARSRRLEREVAMRNIMSRGRRFRWRSAHDRTQDRKIKKLQNAQEIKSKFFSFQNQDVEGANALDDIDQTSNTVVDLTQQIVEGTDNDERIGDSIRVTSVQLNLLFTGARGIVTSLFDDTYNNIRVMLICRKYNASQNNPGNFNLANYLSSAVGTGIGNTLALYKFHNVKGFKVLYDKTFSISDFASAFDSSDNQYNWDAGRSTRLLKKKIKVNKKVQYAREPGISGVITNAIWLVIYSSSTVAPDPIVNGNGRILYKDT